MTELREFLQEVRKRLDAIEARLEGIEFVTTATIEDTIELEAIQAEPTQITNNYYLQCDCGRGHSIDKL